MAHPRLPSSPLFFDSVAMSRPPKLRFSAGAPTVSSTFDDTDLFFVQ